MTNNTSKLFALFAVSLMLFCALVPLVGNDSKATTATDSADDDGKTFSLSELLELIDEIRQNDEKVDYGLVPITDSGNDWEKITIGPAVDGTKEIGKDQYHVLKGTYTFSNNGSIEVKDGGKIVLLPLEAETSGFKLINNNQNNCDLINLHRGALVEVMGMTFVTVCSEDGPTNKTLFRIEQWTASTDPSAEVIFDYTPSDGMFKLELKVGNGAELWIYEFVVWGTDQKSTIKIYDGRVVNNNGKVTIDGCYLVMDNVRHGNRYYTMSFTINKISIQCVSTPKNETTSVETHLKVDVDVIINVLDYKINNDIGEITIHMGSKPSTLKTVDTIELIENTSYSKTDDTLTRVYDIVGAGGIELNLLDLEVYIRSIVSEMYYELDFSNLLLKIDNIDAKITEIVKSDDKYITAKVDSDLEITTDSFDFLIRDKSEIWFPVRLADTDLQLKGMHFEFTDKENMSLKANSLQIQFYCAKNEEFNLNNYTPYVDLEIKSPNVNVVNKVVTIGGVVNLLVSVIDGYEKTMTLTANVNSICINSGSWYLDITSAHLVNNLPVKALTKYIHSKITNVIQLQDDFNIECDATNIHYDAETKILTSDTFWLRYNNFNLLEDFYVTSNGKMSIKNLGQKLEVTSPEITGYTKEVLGDKESFVHTDCKIQLSIAMRAPFIIEVCIDDGSANLGKCTFPFILTVTKNVKDLVADNTEVIRFNLQDGATGRGNIRIDTYKELAPLNGKITFNGKEIVIQSEVNGKRTGLIMTFDLSKKNAGQIVAANNYVLPTDLTIQGLNIERVDGRTANYTVTDSAKKITVDAVCVGEKSYKATFMNGDKVVAMETKMYGDYVDLPDQPAEVAGHRFVGWTDGSGNIYNIGNKYQMPARDVTLTPVYSKIIDVNDIESTSRDVVIDAKGEDVIELTREAVTAISKKNWVTIVSDRVTISTDSKEFLKEIEATEYSSFWISIMKIDKSNNELVQKRIEGTNAYQIDMKFVNKNIVVHDGIYDGKSNFLVTINVDVDNAKVLKDFKVKYVDVYGHEEEVPIFDYTKCDDGTYKIMFFVNHFSTYAVQPIYEDTKDQGIDSTVVLVAAIIIVIAIFGAIYVYSVRNGKKN